MKRRIKASYGAMNDPALLAKGGAILKGLTSIWGAAPQPLYVPSLEKYTEAFNWYHDAFDAAINHDSLKIIERKSARAAFIAVLDKIVQYLEASATDDELHRSGFDLAKERTGSASRTTPPAPLNFTVAQGERRGTLTGSASRQAEAACFELHAAEGDPTVEGNWKFLGVHVRPTMMQITGREPGKQYSFRLRGHNAQGEGPWSPPVSVIAN